MKPEALYFTRQKQRDIILVSLPLSIIGLLIVVYALLEAAWPPDYQDADPFDSASHFQRLVGDDVPNTPNLSVKREAGYRLRRILDALVYYMVFQSVVAVVGLAWLTERYLYSLLVISGLYGMVYAASLGNVIGPILLALGFGLVLWGGVLGWLTAAPAQNRIERLQQESAEI